jgi:DNA-binding response OmpR family regulator
MRFSSNLLPLSDEKSGGDRSMGSIAHNSIPQSIPQSGQRSSKLFVLDPAARPRTIGLKEAQHLSQFVPVVVLVPAGSSENRKVQAVTPRSSSPTEDSGSALLLQFLENAIVKVKAKKIEAGVAFGNAKVNFSSMEATRDGRPVALTSLEFKTLKYLVQYAPRVISRDELLNEVWGYENYPSTRTVDNLILKLRQKFEKDSARPVHFQTVRGAGYKFLP